MIKMNSSVETASLQEDSESEREEEEPLKHQGLFSEEQNFLREEDAISGLDDSSFDQNGYSTESSEESSTDSEAPRRKPRIPKPVLNISHCHYDVIPEAARSLGYRISRLPVPEPEEGKRMPEFDVQWQDGAMAPKKFKKFRAYQRTNHFPGTYEIARKKNLARNLMKLSQ